MRVSDDLEEALDAYCEVEGLDQSAAVRKLLATGLGQWQRQRALDRLEAGEITFSKAVELADTSAWDLVDRIDERGLTWVSCDPFAVDQEDR